MPSQLNDKEEEPSTKQASEKVKSSSPSSGDDGDMKSVDLSMTQESRSNVSKSMMNFNQNQPSIFDPKIDENLMNSLKYGMR